MYYKAKQDRKKLSKALQKQQKLATSSNKKTKICCKQTYMYPCGINSIVIYIVQVDRENGTMPVEKTAITLNFHPVRERVSYSEYLSYNTN